MLSFLLTPSVEKGKQCSASAGSMLLLDAHSQMTLKYFRIHVGERTSLPFDLNKTFQYFLFKQFLYFIVVIVFVGHKISAQLFFSFPRNEVYFIKHNRHPCMLFCIENGIELNLKALRLLNNQIFSTMKCQQQIEMDKKVTTDIHVQSISIN